MTKKRCCILLVLSFFILKSNAQDFSENEKERKDRNTYLNVGYAVQSFESKETRFLSLKSDYAVSFTLGHTFYLHKEPVLNCLKFGIDWTFLDLNFANYTKSYRKEYGVGISYLFQLEAGMQMGPSITLNPVNGLNLNAYFHYAPSFSGFYNGELKPYAYNYAGFFAAGLGISYQVISLGIEKRWGNADYEFKTEDDYGILETNKKNWDTKTTRIYIGFRF
jgi:hypothetical protein